MRLWIIICLLSVLVVQGCLRGAQIKLGWNANPAGVLRPKAEKEFYRVKMEVME